MDHLPIELCTRIFLLACIGDGSVGCSLSRVSKSIRLISAPFRYYSVSIKDLASALHFMELVQAAPKGTIRVSHLFISNDTSVRRRDCIVNPPNDDHIAVTHSRARRLLAKLLPKKYKHLAIKKKENEKPQVRDIVAEALLEETGATEHTLTIRAIHKILIHLTETLITLSITHHHQYHWIIDSLNIPTLPNLTELAVSIRVRGCHCNNIGSLLRVISCLPSLQRLDLSGMHRFDAPDDIILGAAARFPHLTHICLPVVWYINTELVAQMINHAMRNLEESRSCRSPCEDGEVRELPSAPIRVVVQLDPSWNMDDQEWRMAEDIPLSHETRTACLESLRGCAKQHRGRLMIHQRSKFRDTQLDEQERHWMDRAVGGEGCWGADGGLTQQASGV
ncbi:hypothetical protein FIBSPDRAFT_861793 [Athelia psychrophila]|uniref:Uncharacterized protein n=1 Tax=Athelia psychrophila TaxID=1759441 RepID=A0A166IXW8_9AGAM|nr:hypothetical protein FIBSPDRAFT_861793 [Fibularhizoctonia sp. CBS 109695]